MCKIALLPAFSSLVATCFQLTSRWILKNACSCVDLQESCEELPSGRHYSVDWTTGLDYWTHGNCLWGRLNEQQTMRRAKTPSHKTCSSVVVTHLVPSHPAFFISGREPGREPGCSYISTPPTSANAHYELHVESVCVGCSILEWLGVHYLSLLLSSSTSFPKYA